MEPDRYQKNHMVFIIAMISLIFSLSLLAFSLYLLPHLLFKWHYDTPGFIIFWQEWLRSDYDVGATLSSRLILLFFFGLALIFGVITYFSSNRIENQIFSNEIKQSRTLETDQTNAHEGVYLVFKIILIIVIVLIAASFFEWAINKP